MKVLKPAAALVDQGLNLLAFAPLLFIERVEAVLYKLVRQHTPRNCELESRKANAILGVLNVEHQGLRHQLSCSFLCSFLVTM